MTGYQEFQKESKPTRSAEIRSRLGHPVIDSDGHTIEYMPTVIDYLRDVAGTELADRFAARRTNWHRLTPEERLQRRTIRPPWWALPARNTLDRATAMLPALMRERLDEFGIDFSVVYPTMGLFFISDTNDEFRRATCRALNRYHADIFRDHASRMTPVAVIPLHTPDEGIEELDYAVNELGFKAILIPGHIRRTVPEVERKSPEARRWSYWLDHMAYGSEYDYDPFWQRCVDLGVAVSEHSGGMGWGSRNTTDNYVFNHIGHFAAAGEAFCKALVMGGVSRRFPNLNFAFLEGGVGWATTLLADLVSHWEKRNKDAVRHYDPAQLDFDKLAELFDRYGKGVTKGAMDTAAFKQDLLAHNEEDAGLVDEWASAQIESVEDIRDAFLPNFYFGCEADDPISGQAFNRALNPFGGTLNAIFGSDVGHWDVPDMRDVLEEAHEMVEKGLISAENFKRFTFSHVVAMHGRMNPDFFKGTVVEAAAEAELSQMANASSP